MLLGPVVQYKDIQTSLVFLLWCETFKARKMELLMLSVLGHSLISFRPEWTSKVIIYSLIMRFNKGPTAFSLCKLALTLLNLNKQTKPASNNSATAMSLNRESIHRFVYICCTMPYRTECTADTGVQSTHAI